MPSELILSLLRGHDTKLENPRIARLLPENSASSSVHALYHSGSPQVKQVLRSNLTSRRLLIAQKTLPKQAQLALDQV